MRTEKMPELQTERERIGESQSAFAARFGVNQSTIWRWEKFGVPDSKAIRLLIDTEMVKVKRLPSAPRKTEEAAA